ncbi:MAG: RluA family pseudouridine synthase [Treponema sp.]|nr:RluA family pseudouridine synthase [Treponema sp.]
MTLKPLDILFEDDCCIVINKPAGLAVQGGKGIGASLDSILAERYPQRPLLVHRLDRDTSGAILVAKTKPAAAWFSREWGQGVRHCRIGDWGLGSNVISKRYIAICCGRPEKAEGTISLDLDIRGAVKKSATRYRLLESYRGGEEHFSMLELELGTGRMHQIRRHLALSGMPIPGDDKYGDFSLNRRLRKTAQLRRLLLHSSRLAIPAMPDGSRLDVSAPLPEYFEGFVGQLIKINE